MTQIITIDGPAGAGKSTVARRLADRLGFEFLDTGAMYRAVALAGLRRGVDLRDEAALAELAGAINLRFEQGRLLLDGEDVSEAIRTPEATAATKHAADNVEVRRKLIRCQREAAQGRNIVTEGRDQGTLVFPDAQLKVFLTAGAEERAKRRYQQLLAAGVAADFSQVLAAQQQRDAEDQARPFGALAAAPDAFVLNTDGLSVEEVVERLALQWQHRRDS